MTFGSICTGIGGLDLGLERAGMTPKWMCEIDPFCRRVLKKHWPHVPCYEDVRLVRKQKPSRVDVLCGGFPCQPHSCAGLKLSRSDERDLSSECKQLVRFLRPTWFVFENVYGIVSTVFGEMCDELAGEGYELWPLVFRAKDIGSPQNRKRVWFIGRLVHPIGKRLEGAKRGGIQGEKEGQEWRRDDKQPPRPMLLRDWPARPSQKYLVPIATDGLPGGLAGRGRKDRIKALGNAVVPDCAELIGRAIMAADQQFYCRESSNEGIHANR